MFSETPIANVSKTFKRGIQPITVNTLLALATDCGTGNDNIFIKINLVEPDGMSINDNGDIIAFYGPLSYLLTVDNDLTRNALKLYVVDYFIPTQGTDVLPEFAIDASMEIPPEYEQVKEELKNV